MLNKVFFVFFNSNPLKPETLNNNQRNIYIFESEAFIEPFDN